MNLLISLLSGGSLITLQSYLYKQQVDHAGLLIIFQCVHQPLSSFLDVLSPGKFLLILQGPTGR